MVREGEEMAATMTASPSVPAGSPQLSAKTKSPALPPLNTTTTTPTPRKTSSNRPTSFAQRRISSYSSHSKKNEAHSRPISQVFPAFHSSLPYALVRDFAYLSSHPLHYGPQPEPSGVATPASERSRRLSDPAIMGWEDSRNQWSATPPWLAESNYNSNRDQLPAMTFNDGGPPYSEDEDLRSPVVTSKSRHKKSKSQGERGRSPGAAGAGAGSGIIVGANGEEIEEYHPLNTDELDGPGGEIETYPRRQPRHRDSNFAKPLQRLRSPYDYREPLSEEDRSEDDDDDDDDDARYSKDYSFTIASPDEEMHGKAVALFDFVPEHENELALIEGQIILVSYRHGQGWLVAEDPSSGESGLVPEEFVRLVRHIEGGLNGLQAVDLDDGALTPHDVLSPISTEPTSAHSSQEMDTGGHTPKPTNGAGWSTTTEKHPAVQSNFSTSTRDFSPLKREAGGMSPVKE